MLCARRQLLGDLADACLDLLLSLLLLVIGYDALRLRRRLFGHVLDVFAAHIDRLELSSQPLWHNTTSAFMSHVVCVFSL